MTPDKTLEELAKQFADSINDRMGQQVVGWLPVLDLLQSATAAQQREAEQLRACLERAGWGPCNIPACNCTGWHHLRPARYEQEMIDEVTAAQQREVERLSEQLRTEREQIGKLWNVFGAAKEFCNDWRKGDFALPVLAQHDAKVIEEQLAKAALSHSGKEGV